MSTQYIKQEELVALFEAGEKLNPVKFAHAENVTYDENMDRGDFFMVREQLSDSTLGLTIMKISEMIRELSTMTSYSVKSPPDFSRLKGVKYTIGKVSITGSHDPYADNHISWKEIFVMPVKCEYVYDVATADT